MITREQALLIVDGFAMGICAVFPGRILAVFAIGSLGGDYYRPGQSDIDTLIVVDDCDLKPYEQVIEEMADGFMRKYRVPKGFGAVVLNKRSLYPPYTKEDELVLEIINLKTQGLPVYGSLDLSTVPMPDRQAIIDDANTFEDWRDSYGSDEYLLNRQESTNSILMLLKRYLLIEKGIVQFNKVKVVDEYLSVAPPIVNEEVFSLIKEYLVAEGDDRDPITDEQLARMNLFHIELRKYMNRVLLGRA